jgi:glycosyltransferase involved in cell wall biosynthesis
VVDDCSTDASAEVVQSVMKQTNKIQLFQKKNGGVSSARNYGIRNANSEYIALLDGDDLWEPTFLEEQVKLIHNFPRAGMWGVNYAFVKGGRTNPCNQGLEIGFCGYVDNYFGTSHNDLFCSSSIIIRKEVFKVAGCFDERISSSEDLDMWYRIILKYPVVFCDKVLAYYNQNAENRVAYDTGVRFPLTKDIKYYFDKFLPDCEINPVFSHYINNYVASRLLSEGYYFGTKQERIDSSRVVKKLRYKDIHPKYSFIFKTPRWLGGIIYQIVCLKKKIK